MTEWALNEKDLAQLRGRGISEQEARRQLDLLRDPPPPVRLDRACTPGDGILILDAKEGERLTRIHEEAAARGRYSKFIPASGAATRMFRSLLLAASDLHDLSLEDLRKRGMEDTVAGDIVRFLDGLDHHPCRMSLASLLEGRGASLDSLKKQGAWQEILSALLDSSGLGAASQPKALIPFHAHEGGARTPFEEHLRESTGYVRDASGTCRIHMTVGLEHLPAFEELLSTERKRLEQETDSRLEVTFSVQKPESDTLALGEEGFPARRGDGSLLFRPGGHGALLDNLADTGGDLVYLRNIDNVAPETAWGPGIRIRRVLGGLLAELRHLSSTLVQRLSSAPGPAVLEDARAFCRDRLALELPARDDAAKEATRLRDLLDRPLRICGMVRNAGEPGGGPFWVSDESGHASRQIIEAAQIDRADPGQERILREATHFNPVDLVCSLRDGGGRPYDLRRYVDPRAVFVATKSEAGRPILALERPGLWNGSMSRWNTLFVEIPVTLFTPVKTILDLMRPEHTGKPPA